MQYAMTVAASSDVDEDTVYNMVKAIHENKDALVAAHPSFNAMNPANLAVQQPGVTYHPGAIQLLQGNRHLAGRVIAPLSDRHSSITAERDDAAHDDAGRTSNWRRRRPAAPSGSRQRCLARASRWPASPGARTSTACSAGTSSPSSSSPSCWAWRWRWSTSCGRCGLREAPRERVPWYDWILAAISLATGLYMGWHYPRHAGRVLQLSLGRADRDLAAPRPGASKASGARRAGRW